MDGEREPWMDKSSCAQVGGDVFFPEVGESTVEAKRICDDCEVTRDCLIWVLNKRQKQDMFGIVAGLTVDQRRRLRRRAKEQAA